MKSVVLKTAKSYSGLGVYAVAGQNLSVEDDKANALVDSGCFKIVEPVSTSLSSSKEDNLGEKEVKEESKEDKETKKSLSKMTKAELIAYATELNIDVENCNTNDELRAAINAYSEATAFEN